MKLTFLGTGSAYPTDRAQTGLLVEDDPLLIDCGNGVLHTLVQSGVAFTDIEHVLVTHTHLDHVADLLSLAQGQMLAGREELTVYGPPGLRRTVHDWLGCFDYLEESFRIAVTEVKPGTAFDVHGREVRTLATSHGVTTMAYRIDDAFVYSADTEPIDEMADFAEGCEVLVHECSFPDGMESEFSRHTTPSALADVLADCAVERVYLTHLYPEVEGNEAEMKSTIEQQYSGSVTFATDMMEIDIYG